MTTQREGKVIVYCQGAFNTPNGKTAHGLVRFTRRYSVLCVVDSCYRGFDAGAVLDGLQKDIPIFGSIQEAIQHNHDSATHLVIGLAPDGGRMDHSTRNDIRIAIENGLHIVSGLHDFLSEDPEMMRLANQFNVQLIDVRKPPDRKNLHFFSGKIEKVKAFKIAVLGTDSAVGKRTTAWKIVQEFERRGYKSELIGTGQTAWMQGVRFGIILDSLINDFVSGEIEHAVWSAWTEARPEFIVLEGQGSLMNPAYPGGFELLAAGRPDVVILQHAPMRKEYDGFPGYPLHPIEKQIEAITLISGRPVVAITLNHECMSPETIPVVCQELNRQSGTPVFDVLTQGTSGLIDSLLPYYHSFKTSQGSHKAG